MNINQENGANPWGRLSHGNGQIKTDEKVQFKNGKIFAGNIKKSESSKVNQVKEKFKSKAKKIVDDQIKRELQFSKDLDDQKAYSAELEDEADKLSADFKEMNTRKETIREGYGIDANSQEQKDLELLEKVKYGKEALTEEEAKRLAEIGPLTDYQKEILSLDEEIDNKKKEINALNEAAKANNKAVEGAKIEKLKSHAMEDAYKAAEGIMQEASKQVISVAMDEAKEHIDEELDFTHKLDEKEEAKEKEDVTESQKTQDEEVNKEDTNVAELEAIQDLQQQGKEIADKVLKMAKEQCLVSEDTLGIVIDTSL